jgi:alkanesulfonate monooxygenase SsuD/methylene tetrahydromethanopterin reductase-like flavin-dependent oxidoreductase (luciferase family)
VATLGVIALPQLPPERLLPVARAADRAGLEELWLWEDCFLTSGVAAAGAVLGATERLGVGVGVLPVPLRRAVITAMEIATLDRLFPGRVLVGLGHGVQDWMGQAGARVESPLTLLREHLAAVRALLRGERVTVEGRYVTVTDVQLAWPPLGTAPVLAGGEGPKTLRLTGEAADGTILTAGTTPDGVRRGRALVAEGRAAAGRDDPARLVVYLHAATGPTARARLDAELDRWYGRTDAELGVAGDAAEVAGAVQGLVDAGADTVVLQPTPDDPDPEGFVRFAAESVRPLLRPS